VGPFLRHPLLLMAAASSARRRARGANWRGRGCVVDAGAQQPELYPPTAASASGREARAQGREGESSAGGGLGAFPAPIAARAGASTGGGAPRRRSSGPVPREEDCPAWAASVPRVRPAP
jgi:hypothetical protein